MIGRMFERIPAWAIGAAAMVVIVVLIYTAGWWWAGWPAPRWKCNDGYWHWRAECDGHDDLRLLPEEAVAPPGAVADDAVGRESARTVLVGVAGGAHGDDTEAALDEAWAWQLRRFNQDIKTSTATTISPPFTLHKPQPVIDWAGMSWRDRSELERWDWGRRMAADGAEWMHRMDVERHAWRHEMGLAA